jgi:hypothetical protein
MQPGNGLIVIISRGRRVGPADASRRARRAGPTAHVAALAGEDSAEYIAEVTHMLFFGFTSEAGRRAVFLGDQVISRHRAPWHVAALP